MTTATQTKPRATYAEPPAAEPQLLDRVIDETSARIDRLADQYRAHSAEVTGKFRRALMLAEAMRQITGAISAPMMDLIMGLMNSQLGFLTDRDPSRPGKSGQVQPYHPEVVKRCFVESVLLGLNPIGNEWNIISGKVYVTKEGMSRLVREVPGLSDLDLDFNVPKPAGQSKVTVDVSASWRLDGTPHTAKFEIPIKSYGTDTDDLLLGKAERKALHRIYRRLVGSERFAIDETDVDDEPDAEPENEASDAQIERLKQLRAKLQLTDEQCRQLKQRHKIANWSHLSAIEAAAMIDDLEERLTVTPSPEPADETQLQEINRLVERLQLDGDEARRFAGPNLSKADAAAAIAALEKRWAEFNDFTPPAPELASDAEVAYLNDLLEAADLGEQRWKSYLKHEFGHTNVSQLTSAQVGRAAEYLRKQAADELFETQHESSAVSSGR